MYDTILTMLLHVWKRSAATRLSLSNSCSNALSSHDKRLEMIFQPSHFRIPLSDAGVATAEIMLWKENHEIKR